MDNKQLLLLKHVLGEHYLPLMKSIVKQATHSVVDITELHDSLKIVPKAIMTFIMQATQDMENDGAKEVKIPWEENSMMLINKASDDVYRGHFTRDGKVVHEFELCSIPQLCAHLLSFSEMYDEVPEEEAAPPPSDDVKEHLKALDGKINALMMMIASQSSVQKSEDPKSGKWKQLGKSLKKAGLMPGMPKPPKPGKNVGGNQGITKEGIHSDKTAATDAPGHELHTQVKNPWTAKFNAGMKQSTQPKQPKTPSVPATASATPKLAQSEKEMTFSKSELEGKCVDCGQAIKRCACFRALSAPQIKKSENDKITLAFKSDWGSEEIEALYKSIKSRKNE